jgi:tetratricopeptide (TPR) repeat protein
LLALLALAQCGKESTSTPPPERGPITELAEPENALSEALMVSLGQARNYHHKADLLLRAGKTDEAVAAVEAVLAISFPPEAPESEDVILDTHARLAKLRILQNKLAEALSLVDEGIGISTRDSFFLANLHTVRGEVFEATANAAEPNSEAAKEATMNAISAFDASIKINERLLEKLGATQ